MPIDTARLRKHLDEFDFKTAFNELGWSGPKNQKPTPFKAAGESFTRTGIAELAGVMVFEVTSSDGEIPDAKTRRAVHAEISASFQENLILFVDHKRTQSLWYWVKRENGKIYPREHLFTRGQPADLLMSKLVGMSFDISDFDHQGKISVVTVARRLKDALDIERVTKKFFKDFESQHVRFLGLIEGIDNEADRRWYASVLLNRLMFIYFLQKKGFLFVGRKPNPTLDGEYLGEKLAESRKAGKDRYYSEFLKKLFFIGFARPDDDLEKQKIAPVIGDIPYLNGGLFLEHPIEQRYPNIAIPDEAFENLLKLFGSYSWSLDDTPGGTADEINPDVLGYIFEKYINQKAFGAYYTRPEITRYLCERTIHNLILEKVNALAPPPSDKPEPGRLFAEKSPICF